MQVGIRCMLMRGGTSKGAYFLAEDLPSDPAARDRFLLAALGSPDPRQIDGVGGAHPLTSKVAIISRSKEAGIDVDFLFAQVAVDKALVDTTPNCGNILAGTAPFAIERGLIKASDPATKVVVRTVNTGTVAELLIETPKGRVNYEGNARIDGVPGTHAPIPINFLDAAGSVCGSLLPTGNVVDDSRRREGDLHRQRHAGGGHEGASPRQDRLRNAEGTDGRYRIPQAPRSDPSQGRTAHEPRRRHEQSRSEDVPCRPAARGRRDLHAQLHPARGARSDRRVRRRQRRHRSRAPRIACARGREASPGKVKTLSVEHPTGEFTVRLEIGGTEEKPVVERAGLLRTARLLFDGQIFVPEVRARGAGEPRRSLTPVFLRRESR